MLIIDFNKNEKKSKKRSKKTINTNTIISHSKKINENIFSKKKIDDNEQQTAQNHDDLKIEKDI